MLPAPAGAAVPSGAGGSLAGAPTASPVNALPAPAGAVSGAATPVSATLSPYSSPVVVSSVLA